MNKMHLASLTILISSCCIQEGSIDLISLFSFSLERGYFCGVYLENSFDVRDIEVVPYKGYKIKDDSFFDEVYFYPSERPHDINFITKDNIVAIHGVKKGADSERDIAFTLEALKKHGASQISKTTIRDRDVFEFKTEKSFYILIHGDHKLSLFYIIEDQGDNVQYSLYKH